MQWYCRMHGTHSCCHFAVVMANTMLTDPLECPLAARPDLGEGGNLRPVVDLLVEQIECADFVILNKIDQLDAAQLESLKGIASALNPLSKVLFTHISAHSCSAAMPHGHAFAELHVCSACTSLLI